MNTTQILRLNNRRVLEGYKGNDYYSFTSLKFTGDYINKESIATDIFSFEIYKRRLNHDYQRISKDEYVRSCLAQLKFNNWNSIQTFNDLCEIYDYWIKFWPGNKDILEINPETFKSDLSRYFDPLLSISPSDLLTLIPPVLQTKRKHWYSLKIMSKPDGRSRQLLQNTLRQKKNAINRKELFEEACKDLQKDMFGIRPTKPQLEDKTLLSGYFASKYGNGLFIKSSEQKALLITHYRQSNPTLNKNEILEMISHDFNMNMRTLERYWN